MVVPHTSALLFRYQGKSVKLAQFFFYTIGIAFVAYLVTLPAPQAADASKLPNLCSANTGTVLARKEVLIASATLRFLGMNHCDTADTGSVDCFLAYRRFGYAQSCKYLLFHWQLSYL